MQIGIKTFTELQTNYSDKLGLVITGAGEPLAEWVSGLTDLIVGECDAVAPVFDEAFMLSGNVNGADGRTDLVLIIAEDSHVNVGKLAMFRIRFGHASWIEDFLVNYATDYFPPHAFRFRSNPPETDTRREFDACFTCGLPSDTSPHDGYDLPLMNP